MEGVLFSTFWFLAYTLKFGMVWHDAGPPFGETTFNWYFNMILAVYCVLGLYMFKAGSDPKANELFIGFIIWGALFIHLCVVIACVIFEDKPS